MVSAGPFQLPVGSVSFRNCLKQREKGTHSVRLGRERDFGDLGRVVGICWRWRQGSPSGRKFLLKWSQLCRSKWGTNGVCDWGQMCVKRVCPECGSRWGLPEFQSWRKTPEGRSVGNLHGKSIWKRRYMHIYCKYIWSSWGAFWVSPLSVAFPLDS